ncbi:ABC transporter ATP-binding protein [Aquipuribacter hungaricus]|uniref:ABC transporter ATP-binding protein n=1 Tax=Aquipuribacter hungaricus TaxID=545624 RepID=A0ABV7WE60_9MICO
MAAGRHGAGTGTGTTGAPAGAGAGAAPPGTRAGGARGGLRVEAAGLTKRFGTVRAVTDVSFSVEPGQVTGFLGPNGAGKTTTLRMVLGLVRPTAGTVTVDGRPYARLDRPLSRVGAALDGAGAHPGRSGRDHLRWLAAAGGLPVRRCDEVLELTGLADAGGRKVGGFSLGMQQRLALAAAMLGDPDLLVLDEPANGLDPAGIAWLRGFLRTLAGEGRTVLVSSHVLSEVEQTVDRVVVLAAGHVAYDGVLGGLAGPTGVLVDSPDRPALAAALAAEGLGCTGDHSGALLVRPPEGSPVPVDPVRVGAAAARAGVALSHLAPTSQRLEEAFLRLVQRTEQASAAARRQQPPGPAPARPTTPAQPTTPQQPTTEEVR